MIQTSKVEGAANQWRKVPTNCSKGRTRRSSAAHIFRKFINLKHCNWNLWERERERERVRVLIIQEEEVTRAATRSLFFLKFEKASSSSYWKIDLEKKRIERTSRGAATGGVGSGVADAGEPAREKVSRRPYRRWYLGMRVACSPGVRLHATSVSRRFTADFRVYRPPYQTVL